MSGFEHLNVEFVFDHGLSIPELETVTRAWLTVGCETGFEDSGRCFYRGESTDGDRIKTDVKTAVKFLSTDEYGSILLGYDNLDFSVGKFPDTQFGEFTTLSFGLDSVYLRVTHNSSEGLRTNVGSIVELVRSYHRTVSPFHIFSEHVGAAPLSGAPSEPSAERLRENPAAYIGWLTVFDAETVSRYGESTFRETPAWIVERLDDHSLLVVLTENPDPGHSEFIERRSALRDCLHSAEEK